MCGRRGEAVCRSCRTELTPAPSGSPALFLYAGAGRDLVLALKSNRGRAAVPWLALRLAERAPLSSVVTWAPTTPARRRARGYDQAEELARAVGRRLGVPARALLRRTSSEPQHGRPRAERLAGPAFAPRRAVTGHVLLVDDVTTTGATLRAAERCLYRAGADAVQAVAVAVAAPVVTPDGTLWSATYTAEIGPTL